MSRKENKSLKDGKQTPITTLIPVAVNPVVFKSLNLEDYFRTLGLQKDATEAEIKKAYRQLSLKYHPSSAAPNSQPHEEKQKHITEAYRILLRLDPLPFEVKTMAVDYFLNETTFALEPVSTIPPDRLVVLDDYAFDAKDLEELAKKDIYHFYRNPYLASVKDKNPDFSEAAKQTLRAHPVLGEYAKDLDQRLNQTTNDISPLTIDKMIAFLLELHQLHQAFLRRNPGREEWNDEIEGTAEARFKFYEYKNQLSAVEQKQLDVYIIQMPSQYGGSQNVNLSRLIGVNTECIVILQMFLWQFVATVRPSAVKDVPVAVQNMARRHHFIPAYAPTAQVMQLEPDLRSPNLMRERLERPAPAPVRYSPPPMPSFNLINQERELRHAIELQFNWLLRDMLNGQAQQFDHQTISNLLDELLNHLQINPGLVHPPAPNHRERIIPSFFNVAVRRTNQRNGIELKEAKNDDTNNTASMNRPSMNS